MPVILEDVEQDRVAGHPAFEGHTLATRKHRILRSPQNEIPGQAQGRQAQGPST